MSRTATENELRSARAKMMRYCCGEIRTTETCPECGLYLRDECQRREMVVTVRMPKSLHDALLDAKVDRMESINQICVAAIRKAVS